MVMAGGPNPRHSNLLENARRYGKPARQVSSLVDIAAKTRTTGERVCATTAQGAPELLAKLTSPPVFRW
jgi:hypothetical protein